jgi:Zn-dependent M28 family amino/carboxypeptidase
MNTSSRFLASFLAFVIIIGCSNGPTPNPYHTAEVTVNNEQLLDDIRTLSSPEFAGRFPGTEGNLMTQELIIDRFESLGLSTFGGNFRHYFDHTNQRNGREFTNLVNIIGWIEGSVRTDRFIVVTAHYDHLGERDGHIFHGADDNASGVGGLLAAAAWFSEHQPENSIMFIAWDAEEQGLGGARYFVDNPVMPLENIIMNINMDMISLNHENEIYAVGTYHYPYLKPLVEEAVVDADVTVLFGHDSPDLPPGQDWTFSSDHGPFHAAGVPFIYFGVEDHPYYHTPEDTFDKITPEFYYNATRMIIGVIRHMDLNLDLVENNRSGN